MASPGIYRNRATHPESYDRQGQGGDHTISVAREFRDARNRGCANRNSSTRHVAGVGFRRWAPSVDRDFDERITRGGGRERKRVVVEDRKREEVGRRHV